MGQDLIKESLWAGMCADKCSFKHVEVNCFILNFGWHLTQAEVDEIQITKGPTGDYFLYTELFNSA